MIEPMGIIKFSLFLFNIIGWLIADIYICGLSHGAPEWVDCWGL